MNGCNNPVEPFSGSWELGDGMREGKVTGYETIARGSTAQGKLGGQQEFGRAEGGGWLLTKIRG
jgi:hypothetical protein